MSNKKPRGRPVGSGGINDEPALEQMADRIVRNPRLRPTTVYKELDAEWTETSVRRIQAKWKGAKAGLLAAVKERLAGAELAKERAREIATRRSSDAARLPAYLGTFSEHARDLSIVSRALRAQSEMTDFITGGSARRLARDLSVATYMARALDGSSYMRAAQMMDGTLRVARELEETQERLNRMLGLYRF